MTWRCVCLYSIVMTAGDGEGGGMNRLLFVAAYIKARVANMLLMSVMLAL